MDIGYGCAFIIIIIMIITIIKIRSRYVSRRYLGSNRLFILCIRIYEWSK